MFLNHGHKVLLHLPDLSNLFFEDVPEHGLVRFDELTASFLASPPLHVFVESLGWYGGILELRS